MTQVDFYVLEEASDLLRLKAACRLVENAYLAGRRVLCHTGSQRELESLDNLLWTFGDRSFVPHETLGAAPSEAPVLLTAAETLRSSVAAGDFAIVLNLREAAVLDAALFEQVIEVLDGDEGRRRAGRERFRQYRELGLLPAHHKLDREQNTVNG